MRQEMEEMKQNHQRHVEQLLASQAESDGQQTPVPALPSTSQNEARSPLQDHNDRNTALPHPPRKLGAEDMCSRSTATNDV